MTNTDTTTDTPPRPLAVQAAELQGWTRIEPGFFIHTSHTGIPPNRADRMPIPRPHVDPGDALRLLLHVTHQPGVGRAFVGHEVDVDGTRLSGYFCCIESDDDVIGKASELGLEFDAQELPAITRACIAALTALRATTTEAGTE